MVLWPRKEIDYLNEEEIKKIYQSLLARCSFARVPELLWQKRKEALRNDNEQHIVHYLTLLWDDPNRLPPDANADQFSAPLKKGIEM